MMRIPSATVTKWQALSVRRLKHMAELQRSGRWRLIYPTQDSFDDAIRAADVDIRRWKSISYVESPSTVATEG